MQSSIEAILDHLQTEAERHHTTYLELSRRADAEGLTGAGRLLRVIVASERARVALYLACFRTRASDPRPEEYFVCPTCSLAITREPPEQCPVCGAGRLSFVRVV